MKHVDRKRALFYAEKFTGLRGDTAVRKCALDMIRWVFSYGPDATRDYPYSGKGEIPKRYREELIRWNEEIIDRLFPRGNQA